MNYDNWKLQTPPEHDEQLSADCDGVHDDTAGDLRCTACYESGDDDDDDEYAWECEPLCVLVDDEVD